ncbi:MAG: hypothetical protein KAR13_02230, partial [Desulfobulbaceae bacterium]|nr:hypothetical protein [Desulfobulbaceae bacterium]
FILRVNTGHLTVYPKGTSCGALQVVHDQVFQLYISMLEGLIVDRWSAAEYLYINSQMQHTIRTF